MKASRSDWLEVATSRRLSETLNRQSGDETVLVELARAGSQDAFEQLVKLHETLAFRTAVVITGSRADAEDAVQEALLKAWRALPSFRPQSPFRPWLLRIVAHEALNGRRAAGYRARLKLRIEQTADSSVELECPEAAERRARLLEAINSLPERHRLVFACRYVLGLSEDETAAVLCIPVGTVKSRTARALAKLRQKL